MTKEFFQDPDKVKDKVNRAKELVKEARMTKGLERIGLVRMAIEINPDCMEAYLILGDEERDSSDQVNLYRKAVDAGRRRLGSDFFLQNEGNFWQFGESRSFLIVVKTLADKLVEQYSYDEAVSYYYQLLKLDVSDNQDVRYSLFRLLIIIDRYREARKLLDTYQELTDLRWLYNDLLLSYLEQGTTKEVRMKAHRAITQSEPVCQLLLEPISLIEAHVDIDENETDLELTKAVNYINDHLDLWSSQPEILEWLRKEYYGFNNESSEKSRKPLQICDTRYLVQRGNSLIEAGDFIQADKLLTQALMEKEDPMVRNNLGYCKILMHNYQEAFEVLKLGLGNGFLNPFGYALASECAFYLEDELSAYRYLQHAIRDFDLGMRTSVDLGPFADHWHQYTVIIKAVAGLLGNDRLVINLHKKWDHYFISVESLYQLGVAYFNCKNYTQAIRIWNQITAPEWGFLDRFKAACHIFKAQIVPAPRLEYLPPWYLMDDMSIDYSDIDQLISSAGYQVVVIADLFEHVEADDHHGSNVEVLTLSSLGKWGAKFGQAILATNCLPYCWKIAAIIGLMNQGIYNYGDQVKINLNDEWTEILIEKKLINRFADECLPDFLNCDLGGNHSSNS